MIPQEKVDNSYEDEMKIAAVDALDRELLGESQLHESSRDNWLGSMLEPLRHAYRSPGKGLRSLWIDLLCDCLGIDESEADWVKEIGSSLHEASLLIDDWQDAAKIRRGEDAAYLVYGAEITVASATWLYFDYEQVLLKSTLNDGQQLRAHRAISKTLRLAHQGQCLDISSQLSNIPKDEVEPLCITVASWKTGQLLGLMAELLAIHLGYSHEKTEAIRTLSVDIGKLLQQVDDLSSFINAKRMAKSFEDIIGDAPNFAWALIARDCNEAQWEMWRRGRQAVVSHHKDLENFSRRIAEFIHHRSMVHTQVAVRRILDDAKIRLGEDAEKKMGNFVERVMLGFGFITADKSKEVSQ